SVGAREVAPPFPHRTGGAIVLENRPPPRQAVVPETAGDPDFASTVGVHDPEVAALLIGDARAVRGPAGGAGGRAGIGETDGIRAVGIHDPDGEVRLAIRLEGDLRAVRRPGRRIV